LSQITNPLGKRVQKGIFLLNLSTFKKVEQIYLLEKKGKTKIFLFGSTCLLLKK
jgi:hypothetical protein